MVDKNTVPSEQTRRVYNEEEMKLVRAGKETVAKTLWSARMAGKK